MDYIQTLIDDFWTWLYTFQHLVFNGFYTFDLFDDAGAKRLIVDMNHFQFSAEF